MAMHLQRLGHANIAWIRDVQEVLPNTGENWSCPYCGQAQVIATERHYRGGGPLYIKNWVDGAPGYIVEAIVCANSACRKLSVDFCVVHMNEHTLHLPSPKIIDLYQHWSLLPASSAKPQPDFIPKPLRRDYEEACAIRDLSPKASATLTRRCIQGIIRDFCGISKRRLIDEIQELRSRVDAGNAPNGVQQDTVDAIDHVRGIGNIGAHMESDINVIVDVDPNEAQVLIELVEMLFDEWYVSKEMRTQRLKALAQIAGSKASDKKPRPPDEVEEN